MRKGVLPKDVIEKLKQIEKLSKRLRTEPLKMTLRTTMEPES